MTYRGHTMGLYPYGAIPFVFVFAFLVVIGILLVVLPVLSRWERDREG
ncbi:MAG: hypothetical protein SV377_06740 [Halobacteria archaeon]|nr:hypothetical protein [Halobacteria archaeon]